MYNKAAASTYDENNNNYYSTPYISQTCEKYKLCLTDKYPDINRIKKTSANITITSFKLVSNAAGAKIAVNSLINIKVFYLPQGVNSKTLCAKFTIPFCTYIPINNDCGKIKDIEISIENICTQQISDRTMLLSMIISAWPLFENQYSNPSLNSHVPEKLTSNINNIIIKIICFFISIWLYIKEFSRH